MENSNTHTTTLGLTKGMQLGHFIREHSVEVKFDPVANMIFTSIRDGDVVLSEDCSVDLMKVPAENFLLDRGIRVVYDDLPRKNLKLIHECFAMMLFHQDKDILLDGEAALVFTPILEHGMFDDHIFSIRRDGDVLRCDYAPINEFGLVQPMYPIQWCIAAKKEII